MSKPDAVAPILANESIYPMIPVEEAINIVLSHTRRLETVNLELVDALNYSLIEDIFAPTPFPSFRASIMDGFAVHSSDGIGKFPIIESITAGNTGAILPKGCVAYITTGSPIPEGADAVVKVESTKICDAKADIVEILEHVKPGTFIRPIGFDVKQGEKVFNFIFLINI